MIDFALRLLAALLLLVMLIRLSSVAALPILQATDKISRDMPPTNNQSIIKRPAWDF